MQLIDSHCHLDFPVFDANRKDMLAECRAAGINQFIVPGVSQDTFPRLLKLKNDYQRIHIAFGLHPYFIDDHEPEHIEIVREFCENHSPVAVGEIGLDFYRKDLDRNKQLRFFQGQLQLAESLSLPVILHVRKAHQDVLTQLKKFNLPGGIAHAFNGSIEQAHQYISLGFKLGFGGALTYPNARKLHSLIKTLPLEAIVLETDSPDMKPHEYSLTNNTPLTLLRVIDVIAKLRNSSTAEIARVTTQNIEQKIFKACA